MSTSPPVTDEIKQAIHFDTLLAQAMAVVVEQSGQRWTDRAEHDPGVTLLQALCYNVADLAYRHVLPLTDLLTKDDASGLFPAGFGPEDALTCSPVTLDDYRAGFLDIADSDNRILFRNAWMRRIEADDAEAYVYFYDHVQRAFSFIATEDSKRIALAGDYALVAESWIWGPPDAGKQQKLQQYLTSNRNIGEGAQIILGQETFDRRLLIELEVTDDTEDIYPLVMALYWETLDYIRPRAHWSGVSGDGSDRWDGPRLQHGRAALPPVRAHDTKTQLTPLAELLRRLPGVRALGAFSSVNETAPWLVDNPAGSFSRLWGYTPSDELSSGNYVNFYKRGKRLPIDPDRLCALFQRDGYHAMRPPIVDTTPPAPGHHRTAPYHPASLRLPPCYGLQTPEPDPQQQQLHRFLLPFEQELANRCAQLASLPELLAFDRSAAALGEDGQVWGATWPYRDDDPLQEAARTVHAAYREELEQVNDTGALDYEKELDLIDHLLGYFGAARAPRALLRDYTPAQFLQVQRGYLRQIAELGYGRARIQIDRVSAVQRRIAARLGWGPQLFGDDPPLDNLPFYVIERRALLPVKPEALYDSPQVPAALDVQGEGQQRVLWLSVAASTTLRAGMVIEFVIDVDTEAEVIIGPMIINQVEDGRIGFTFADNARLDAEIGKLLTAQDDDKLTWRNAPVWLQDIEHRLTALRPITGQPTQRLIMPELFPAGLQPGDKVLFKLSLAAQRATGEGAERLEIEVDALSADPLGGSLVGQAGEDLWAVLENGNLASWRMVVVYAVDNITDRFSFMVSVVLPRSVVQDEAGDPQATADWIGQIVREEMPAHVVPALHWLDASHYGDFAGTYSRWQNGGQPLGDLSYRLLQQLSVGELRAGIPGINARRVATTEQQAEGTGSDGNYDPDYVAEHELMFVPMNTGKTSK